MKHLAVSVPWTSATHLDRLLTLPGRSAAGLQKTRQALRHQIAPAETISLGRRGTVSLDNAALISCLTAARWDTDAALELGNTYREAGMPGLVSSNLYRDALSLATSAIRDRAARETGSNPLAEAWVPELMVDLLETNPTVRNVARAMSEIHAEVALRRPEIRWFGGKLVRFEGPEAIVVLDMGGREVLKSYDASYLKAQGIEDEDDAFVLQEIRWSPDAVVSAFLPAYDPDGGNWLAVQSSLAQHERPLSELPEHLITGEASPQVSKPPPVGSPGQRSAGWAVVSEPPTLADTMMSLVSLAVLPEPVDEASTAEDESSDESDIDIAAEAESAALDAGS